MVRNFVKISYQKYIFIGAQTKLHYLTSSLLNKNRLNYRVSISENIRKKCHNSQNAMQEVVAFVNVVKQ